MPEISQNGGNSVMLPSH